MIFIYLFIFVENPLVIVSRKGKILKNYLKHSHSLILTSYGCLLVQDLDNLAKSKVLKQKFKGIIVRK